MRNGDAGPVLLSILIATLESRRDLFLAIERKLRAQVRARGLERDIEILSFPDRGELPTGAKRNALIERAQGRFVCFVDDDDDVHDDYVGLIVEALRSHPAVDCIGIVGRVTYRGEQPRTFIYSRRYTRYACRGGVYERPPHHLNPTRREIALRYPFEEIWKSEDADWSLRLCRDGALRSEHFIEETLYLYNSRRRWAYQRLLDATEFIRHPLGIQLVNRVRLRRWLRAHLSFSRKT